MITMMRRGFLVLLLSLPLLAIAAAPLSPQQVVQETTSKLLQDLKANKEHYRNSPQAFYQAMDNILGPEIGRAHV